MGTPDANGSGTQVINPNAYWPTRLSIG